jgi:hypothetical protein
MSSASLHVSAFTTVTVICCSAMCVVSNGLVK